MRPPRSSAHARRTHLEIPLFWERPAPLPDLGWRRDEVRSKHARELETLLEDAFVVRDRDALAELFDDGALLVAGGDWEARGGEQIARLATAMWDRDDTYVAAPRRVLQAREITLVVAARGINVVRRGSDGRWRYAISLLTIDDTTRRENR